MPIEGAPPEIQLLQSPFGGALVVMAVGQVVMLSPVLAYEALRRKIRQG
ncbi:MAG: hypothetical protein K1X65_22155 [Caldilineales bacterium]|nr:hypothetical protein [Caldilineales bacterium]